ncbi:uncharacterized protein EV154DRAFT_557591 [Mucor mucedo]|uniref:uncharacterized protein n=1 Tax=Mucor mucedo TaxID=29922 RepID=UPI00221E4BB7|nr:uncharacterized protein EV154DRAFT_557591 [Mucor mucedo]KAI7897270.1 hypothetical protein EV154DRAFT_557591 [Mucor mucedo]
MLQSKALSIRNALVQKTRENNETLANLQFLMDQRLVQLDFIQKLLQGTDNHAEVIEERIHDLEEQCQHSYLQAQKSQTTLEEKTRDLHQAQEERDKVQASLDSLSSKYDSDREDWKRKYELSQHQLVDAQTEYIEQKGQLEQQVLRKDQHIDQLSSKNEQLETELKQQAERLEVESNDQVAQLKMELEHKLSISNDELDHQKETNRELQERLTAFQSQVAEKDQMLENLKAQVDPQEHDHVLQQLEDLKEENEQYRKRLADINHSREEFELDKSKHGSRIPVLSNRAIQQQHDLTKEFDLMKDDLLLYQDKLVEKISQNEQLESALERVNEHVSILRKSLNDTREESALRYKNMMKYMEENRVLREQLEG